MGDKIKGKEQSGIDGKARRTPSWELVLYYEEKVREKVAKLMSESHRMRGEKYDLASALKTARESRELLEDEFLDKLRFQDSVVRPRDKARGSKGRQDSPSPPPTKKPRNLKNGNKGGGKGKGGGDKKGDESRPPADANNRTLHTKKDGKSICFFFNRKTGCNRGDNCKMAHACQICLSSKHSMEDCKSK